MFPGTRYTCPPLWRKVSKSVSDLEKDKKWIEEFGSCWFKCQQFSVRLHAPACCVGMTAHAFLNQQAGFL